MEESSYWTFFAASSEIGEPRVVERPSHPALCGCPIKRAEALRLEAD